MKGRVNIAETWSKVVSLDTLDPAMIDLSHLLLKAGAIGVGRTFPKGLWRTT